MSASGSIFNAPGCSLSSDAEVALDVGEDTIAQGARLADIASAQGEAQTLSRGIRFMHRHVAPPHPSVVPEVMILVIIIDAKSNLGILGRRHECIGIEKKEAGNMKLKTSRLQE